VTRSQLIAAVVAGVLSLLVPAIVTSDYELQVLFRIYLFAALGWPGIWWADTPASSRSARGLLRGRRVRAGTLLRQARNLAVARHRHGRARGDRLRAALIGGVSFRLRGPYFALSTIAFGEILRLVAKNLPNVTGGDVGVQVPALFQSHVNRNFYWAAVVLTAVAFAVTIVIARGRFGYYLMAIRETRTPRCRSGSMHQGTSWRRSSSALR